MTVSHNNLQYADPNPVPDSSHACELMHAGPESKVAPRCTTDRRTPKPRLHNDSCTGVGSILFCYAKPAFTGSIHLEAPSARSNLTSFSKATLKDLQ
jgi:hypothetical protein